MKLTDFLIYYNEIKLPIAARAFDAPDDGHCEATIHVVNGHHGRYATMGAAPYSHFKSKVITNFR